MAQEFLVQRYFAELKIGESPYIVHRGAKVPIFCRQGRWDGACGLYCAGMALALLGLLPQLRTLSSRRRGLAGALWRAGQEAYFDGIDAADMADLLASLSREILATCRTGRSPAILSFALEHLEKGGLVLLSWRTRRWRMHDWVLAVGVEGMQAGRAFRAHGILALDPDAEEPRGSGCNARLCFAEPGRRYSSRYLQYRSSGSRPLRVVLTGAVALSTVAVDAAAMEPHRSGRR